MTEKVIAHIDGGSRGNPGPAASGFVLADSAGKQIKAAAFYLGEGTNNFAEYTSILKALEAAKKIGAKQIDVYSDSELLVRQINGEYKVRSEVIRPLFAQAIDMLNEFENWQVKHIGREKNKKADEMVNRALDIKRDVEEKTKNIEHRIQNTEQKISAIRLGVLISGGGTTLVNLAECIKKGKLNAQIAVVISSRKEAAGVERAKAAGFEVKIIRTKDNPDIDEFSKLIEEELVAAKVDLVIQGGWLCLWKIPAKYQGKVMNIHPALLPSFGGKGMWGHHVHEAVLKAGCKVSGCTVHFCTNEYDTGPIIMQRCCRVENSDTAETLAARVFKEECIAYPAAIRLFAEGKLTIKDGKVSILDEEKNLFSENDPTI